MARDLSLSPADDPRRPNEILTSRNPSCAAFAGLPIALAGLAAFILHASGLLPPLAGSALAQAIPAAVPAQAAPIAYDDLRWKGLEVELPAPKDTVDGLNEARERLARQGIGYLAVGLQTFSDNVLPTPSTTNGKQTFSGQRPTFVSQDFFLLTYDAGRVGLDGGQFVVGGSRSYYTWTQGGPDRFGLLTLSYNQLFLDGRVALKVGYLVDVFEYANYYVGGSLATGPFGQSGNFLLQGGLTGGGITAPGAQLSVKLPGAFYTKASIERPISPDGTIVDSAQNPTGLRVRLPNTGLLAIDETGYRVAPSAATREVWLRGAAAINTSHYLDLAHPGRRSSEANAFAYLLGDVQLTQPDPARPARGAYLGATVVETPGDLNRFAAFFQGRAYVKGPLSTRPADLVSLVLAYNQFSPAATAVATAARQLAHRSATAITASYAARLAPGLFLNLGLTYTDHPTAVTYAPTTGSALNALVNLSTFF